jgi:hypothetical protein
VLFALGIIGLPDAELEGNRWGEVEGQDVAVITEVVLDNPNPSGFGDAVDVTYDVGLTELEQPRDQLEAVGVVIDLDDEGGILP